SLYSLKLLSCFNRFFLFIKGNRCFSRFILHVAKYIYCLFYINIFSKAFIPYFFFLCKSRVFIKNCLFVWKRFKLKSVFVIRNSFKLFSNIFGLFKLCLKFINIQVKLIVIFFSVNPFCIFVNKLKLLIFRNPVITFSNY